MDIELLSEPARGETRYCDCIIETVGAFYRIKYLGPHCQVHK